MKTNQKKAYGLAALTILFWSTSASAFKIGLRYIDHYQLLFIATLTAVVFLFLVLLAQKRVSEVISTNTSDIRRSALLGFLNPFLYYSVLFVAYSLLPAQVAQPLNFVWPIALVLLSVPILKQTLTLKSIAALVISFMGVVFISTEGNILNMSFASPLGVSLALLSSIVWALFWLFNVKDQRDEIIKLFYNFLFALVLVSITTLMFSSFKGINFKGVLSGIYIGLFEMGITFVLWLKALRLSERTDKLGNLIYLTPFCSLIFISIILKEKIFITTLIGLILIVTGIFIQQTRRNEKQNC